MFARERRRHVVDAKVTLIDLSHPGLGLLTSSSRPAAALGARTLTPESYSLPFIKRRNLVLVSEMRG